MAIRTDIDVLDSGLDHVRRRIVAFILLIQAATMMLAILGLERNALPKRPTHVAKGATSLLVPRSYTQLIETTPPVLPNIIAGLTSDQARVSNAAVPYAPGKLLVLSRFVYAGSTEDRASASTCLAAAVLYEAGDDKLGEQAVAQVVLNRLRHPAFPKTVCGVVFQGSERTTGCQFTFTCDGSLHRPPLPQAWKRAKQIAEAALSGYVDVSVGTATHYHTDWVVPYWRDTLTKVAKVGTQIFYRWPGGWGSPPAFVGLPQPGEQVADQIRPLLDTQLAAPELALDKPDDVQFTEASALPRPDIAGIDVGKLGAGKVIATNADHTQFVVLLDPSAFPGSYALASLALCKGSHTCWTMGWVSAAKAPHSLQVSPSAFRSMSFIYRRSGDSKPDLAQWDCELFPRPDEAQCIPTHQDNANTG